MPKMDIEDMLSTMFGKSNRLVGMIPMLHVGIESREVKAPGFCMSSNGDMMAFVGAPVRVRWWGQRSSMVIFRVRANLRP